MTVNLKFYQVKNMKIERIDSYTDNRFSGEALFQHGCFLADDVPCEVQIVSDNSAVISGKNSSAYSEVIEEFRFYAPHIVKFYDKFGGLVKEYPQAKIITIPLEQIQPSQFYVDEQKIAAIKSFIHSPEDIIVQVMPYEGRYISLDGHTRLYYAVLKGWNTVRAISAESNDYIYDFVAEAKRRNILTPKNMNLVSHEEYERKWNSFCDAYFSAHDDDGM